MNYFHSIRALYGTDNTQNACHGSDSVASATREIRYFFPHLRIDPLPSPEVYYYFIILLLSYSKVVFRKQSCIFNQ